MWRNRATRERAELVVEPRMVPARDGILLFLLPCLLTARRRRGVEDKDKREVVGDGEDKPTPAAPISGGVSAARRGAMPSFCGGVFTGCCVPSLRISLDFLKDSVKPSCPST